MFDPLKFSHPFFYRVASKWYAEHLQSSEADAPFLDLSDPKNVQIFEAAVQNSVIDSMRQSDLISDIDDVLLNVSGVV